MARLPSKFDLSQPASFRSGRAIAQLDTSGLGRGIAAAGAALEGLGAQITQSRNAVDIPRSEAHKTEQFLALENSFDRDPDYATYQERASKAAKDIIHNSAQLIRDPRMRERWVETAREDAARLTDRIRDKGFTVQQQAETVAFDEALETNRRLYVDPNTPELAKEKARADIAASIDAGEASGLLSPEQAQARREQFLNQADYSRAQLAVENDPSSVPLPSSTSVVDRIIRIESGGNPNAKNPSSSATGAGQFISSTWLNMIRKYRPDLASGRSNGEILALRKDGALSREMVARYAEENANYLGSRGHAATPGNVYLAHFLGPAGAATVLGSDDGTALSSVLPDATMNANKFLKGMTVGGLKAWATRKMGDGPAPEWYTRLSPEQRQVIHDRQSAKETELAKIAAAQQKAAYEAYKDERGLAVLTGGIRSELEILNDATLNDGDKASLLRTFRTEMKDQLATAAAVQEFAGGDLRVDPYDTDGRKTVDNVYDAATKASPENIRPITEELVRQTGVVPKQALSLIRQGMTSTDVNAVMEAAQAAQRLSSINPAALSRREGGSEVQQMADDFGYYVNNLNLSPEDAARRIREAQDPAKQRERKALEPAAKEFLKGLEGFDLAGEFDESFMGLASDPALGFNEKQRLGILAEFHDIAEDQFYRSNGDPEIAKNRAMQEMKRLYGVTELTGTPTIMKHPPERYWPAYRVQQYGETSIVGDTPSLEYATMQLRDELRSLYGDNVDMSRVQLVTTSKTDRLVKENKMPGYGVLYKDENGVLQALPGKVWLPDTEPARKRQSVVEGQERAEAERLAREAEPRLRQRAEDALAGRDRERTLDAFLDGPTLKDPGPDVAIPQPAMPQQQLPDEGDIFEGAMP